MSGIKLFPVHHWLRRRQSLLLSNAYSAAQGIRALEEQYGQGQPILNAATIGQTVYDYVRGLCDRKRFQIRDNLAQLRVNSFLLGQPSGIGNSLGRDTAAQDASLNNAAPAAAVHDLPDSTNDEILQKLSFIESVIAPYRFATGSSRSSAQTFSVDSASPSKTRGIVTPPLHSTQLDGSSSPADLTVPLPLDSSLDSLSPGNSAAQKTDPALFQMEVAASELAQPGLLGSFSLNREQTEAYEKRVIQELRERRQQSKIALRWLAILLLTPILIAVLVKQLVLNPALGNYSDLNPSAVELSEEIKTEFIDHLAEFKEELEIRELLNLSPALDPKAKQEQLAEKASEFWREARNEELNGLKNVVADCVATLAFIAIAYFNRDRLRIIRAFSNRAFLSLSDPIKIFVFILVTDMFVGFHSAEGWDAILSGVTRHFGLIEHPDAIKLFIATVPVMMDSGIKFWIFNYLTRVSPASSAIFERMNT